MTLFNIHRKTELIYPGEQEQVSFWTKKWGITAKQLNDAIIETGSINLNEIKSFLVKKGVLFSIHGTIKYLKYKCLKCCLPRFSYMP